MRYWMRYLEISTETLVLIIVSLFFLGGTASAVDSFGCTGHEDEGGHTNFRDAIKQAQNEFNDYYNSDLESHDRDTTGKEREELVMYIQRNQPQHYIHASHASTEDSSRGKNIASGEGSREYIYGGHWDIELAPGKYEEDVMTGERNGFCEHPLLPMSAVLFMPRESGYTEDRDNSEPYNAHVFMYWARSWIFVGLLNSPRTRYVRTFIETYTDRVCDYKYSYEHAIDIANEKSRGKCETILYGWGSGNNVFEHTTFEDKYRNIDRVIYDGLHEKIYEEQSRNLEYERDFSGDSNGAYAIFHCWVGDDRSDTSTEADILIEIFTKEDGDPAWGDPISTDGFDITNQGYNGEYGGSHVCSVYISAADLEAADTIRAKVTHEQGSDADFVMIQRFEIMEIGA